MSSEAIPEQIAAAGRLRAAADLWLETTLRGALLILLGGALLFYPFTTLFSLTVALGLVALADGALSLARGLLRLVRGRPGAGAWIGRAGLGIALGVLVLFAPLLATFAYAQLTLTLAALWLIAVGLRDLMRGLRGSDERGSLWWGGTLMIAGIALLILVLEVPGAARALGWILSIGAIFAGLTLVSRGLLLRATAARP